MLGFRGRIRRGGYGSSHPKDAGIMGKASTCRPVGWPPEKGRISAVSTNAAGQRQGPMKQRAFRLTAERRLEPCPVQDASNAARDPRSACWIDVEQRTSKALAEFIPTLDLHPLAVEACLDATPASRFSAYGDSLFVALATHTSWEATERTYLILRRFAPKWRCATKTGESSGTCPPSPLWESSTMVDFDRSNVQAGRHHAIA